MGNVQGLRCRECGQEYDLAAMHVCEYCFGPLEVVYDYERIAAGVSRESIAAGPLSLWRYADLLPELPGADGRVDPSARVDLGAGFTPLVHVPKLGEALGLRDLWVKNDSVNPTLSFKDRVVSVAVTAARRLGYKTVACASTGNLANAVSAHAARAGMDACVFIPADLEPAKVTASAIYDPTVVAINGTYDDVNRLCAEVAGEYGWAFVNVNVRPFYTEGSKTIAFEIAEQLGWRLPDHVVAPMASGAMLVKLDKGFGELSATGLVEERPYRISGAQAAGCAPISTAWNTGADRIVPVRPQGIAKSLAIGDPADGYYAIDAVRRTGGWIGDVTDEEIIEGMKLLAATEGIFTETAGGVTVACLRKAAAQGLVDADERTVAVISGNGLKTLDALGDDVGATHTIDAGLGDFERALGLKEAS